MIAEVSENHLYALFERVGNLAGQFNTLHQTLLTSLSAAQQRDAASSERIEGLERRMNSLEQSLVTRSDFQGLTDMVGDMRTEIARLRGGGLALAGLAPWLALIISLLALIGVGRNQSEMLRLEQRTAPVAAPPATSETRRP